MCSHNHFHVLGAKWASSGHITTTTKLFTVLKEGFGCFKIILVTHIHFEDFASSL
jgi:hypothetical protein